METVYDWVTVVIFGGLIVLFLQRSSAETPSDHMYQYAPPAVGCAVANYIGNQEMHWLAIIVILGIGIYVWRVLKPLAP